MYNINNTDLIKNPIVAARGKWKATNERCQLTNHSRNYNVYIEGKTHNCFFFKTTLEIKCVNDAIFKRQIIPLNWVRFAPFFVSILT